MIWMVTQDSMCKLHILISVSDKLILPTVLFPIYLNTDNYLFEKPKQSQVGARSERPGFFFQFAGMI